VDGARARVLGVIVLVFGIVDLLEAGADAEFRQVEHQPGLAVVPVGDVAAVAVLDVLIARRPGLVSQADRPDARGDQRELGCRQRGRRGAQRDFGDVEGVVQYDVFRGDAVVPLPGDLGEHKQHARLAKRRAQALVGLLRRGEEIVVRARCRLVEHIQHARGRVAHRNRAGVDKLLEDALVHKRHAAVDGVPGRVYRGRRAAVAPLIAKQRHDAVLGARILKHRERRKVIRQNRNGVLVGVDPAWHQLPFSAVVVLDEDAV